MAAPRYGSPIKRAVTFYIPLTVMVGATLFPFYWMVITSVRPDVELYNVKMNPFFTLHPTLTHFYYLFELTMFPRWAWNTLFIATVSTGISLFCGLLAGYALARLQFRWAPPLGTMIFITYLVPPTLLFIPLGDVVKTFGLGDTPWAVILTYPTFLIPFCTWLLMGYFKTIPREIEECARIDGPSRSQAMGRISFPLAVPGIAFVARRTALAKAQPKPAEPPSVITTPPRDFGPNAPPNVYFVDPDVVTVDPSFNALRQANAPIQRLWTGALWSEGPAWNSQGRYLVWSAIPNNRQLRWLEDDGRVSVFRLPSNNSNGNTFDFQGRQLSCEHLTRRVVRYDHDGSITVIADSYDGKRLNSPNDVVPHPDGSVWFTDPPYGGQLYEGAPDAPGGPSNRAGRLKPRLGQAVGIGEDKRELPTNCYRVDPSGRVDLVVSEDQVPDPNGLCFSPDYQKLYVISTGRGPGDTGPGGKRDMYVFDVGSDHKLSNQKLFTDFMVDGVKCGPDGVRADVEGNLWVSSNAGRAVGYSGVTVWNPEGKLIGRVRLPEVCGNLCFGGPKRNRLFMAASQSLYALYVSTQGAAPGQNRGRSGKVIGRT